MSSTLADTIHDLVDNLPNNLFLFIGMEQVSLEEQARGQ